MFECQGLCEILDIPEYLKVWVNLGIKMSVKNLRISKGGGAAGNLKKIIKRRQAKFATLRATSTSKTSPQFCFRIGWMHT